MEAIRVRGARQHNLRNLDLDIPRNRLVVVTGLSGSGKSSLAFDTLYAEGQRRYIESLSTYARQFLEQMEKPDVDTIEGLSPAISIEQKTTSRNARSTVGTITEIYDYFRLLFSSVGTSHCPRCDRPISRQTVDQIVDRIFQFPRDSRIMILAPVVRERKGEFRKLFERFLEMGFLRARVDGEVVPLEDPPRLNRRQNHTVEVVVDRLLVQQPLRQRVDSSVRQALRLAGGLVTISMVGGEEVLLSEKMACVECGINVPALEPRSFSFNSRFGACPRCEGLGTQLQLDLFRLVEDASRPLETLEPVLKDREFRLFFHESASALLEHYQVDRKTPLEGYPPEVLQALIAGVDFPLVYRYRDFTYESRFDGLAAWLQDRIDSTSSPKRRQQLMAFMQEGDCSGCCGARLKSESRAVRVGGRSISDYCRVDLGDCMGLIQGLKFTPREEIIGRPLISEIEHRLRFLERVGLSYLALDRKAATLSGGEAQRIRLATQVGSRLQGILYVLDEPSIGLHARDTDRLLATLEDLRDLGNTIVLVEHDEDTIRCADHVIDLGPGGGSRGGRIVAQGTVEEISGTPESLTGQYLKGARRIDVNSCRRTGNGARIELRGVRHNNLQNIDIAFPLGVFISVTGVSGSGKSSLVDEVLYRALSQKLYRSLLQPGPHDEIRGLEQIDKVIEIDQSPIGRTPRSNPATYTGLFTPIRELFAHLPDSRMRGYKPGRFSFNVKGGRCEVCRGDGLRKIEMNFLPDVYVECESCRGRRYNRETLSVKFKGHSIADILDLSIADALPVLENVPRIKSRLKTLLDVGLGYVKLGQPATTLSGGEAQRVKLSRELSKRQTGRTLYILDEPTTGLHFDDVRKLLEILHELVNLGNTVIVIEHNLDVIKSADWVIDLGPEGGKNGGRVVAAATPEELVQIEHSHTGRALRRIFG